MTAWAASNAPVFKSALASLNPPSAVSGSRLSNQAIIFSAAISTGILISACLIKSDLCGQSGEDFRKDSIWEKEALEADEASRRHLMILTKTGWEIDFVRRAEVFH